MKQPYVSGAYKPKYGRGELPVEHTPMTVNKLEEGKEFGPIKYTARKGSHEKQKQLLNDTLLAGGEIRALPSLTASELWPLIRVLSRYFGRLNEFVAGKCEIMTLEHVPPGSELYAQATVTKVEDASKTASGLPHVVFESVTRTKDGKEVLRATNSVFLLHGYEAVMKRILASSLEIPFVSADVQPPLQLLRTIKPRFDWNPKKWKKNIHAGSYAESLGYKGPVAELHTYIDMCEDVAKRIMGDDLSVTVSIKRVMPLYFDDTIQVIIGAKNGDCSYPLWFTDEQGDKVKLVGSVRGSR